ncbi:ribonuclease HII [Acidaminobacter sp. JC074]|uniref:ribonuclease HII n=1 Tax=Acidaminobacter sp. JC074 TaxID=2530199 RepID=UPI002104C795|nr:ribonuclease HII [Acidaminobacter sp. JC074]
MKKISEYKEALSLLSIEDQVAYVSEIKDDRKGVLKLIESVHKKALKHQKELDRVKGMMVYEEELLSRGPCIIAGLDEVGRGPLAGPVVTCAVVLNDLFYEGINDSKKVSLKNRERLFDEITESAVEVSYGIATNEEIDELNILNATKLAMKRAIEGLKRKPDHLLIDAVKLDDIDIDQTSIIKGDEKSVSIAAASILAKVTRDRMMIGYDKTYPHYDFASNKGYGTRAHYDGLNAVGISPIHRKTFVKDFV